MRLAVISDIHFNLWNYGATLINGRNSRLLDQRNVFFQFIDYVRYADIDYVLVCGDVFDKSKVPAEVLMTAHECFSALKRHAKVFILVGNHDCSDKQGEIHALSMLSNYARVIDSPVNIGLEDGFVLSACPYTEDKDKLQSFLNNTPDNAVVMMHQGVSGIEINSKGFTLNELLTPSMFDDRFKFGFTGHYHSAKVVKDNLIIPGSPMQFNWGDKNEARGWWDIDLYTNEVKHVESVAPKFVELSMGQKHKGQDFLRVQLADPGLSMDDARNAYPEARTIELIHEKPEARYDRIERFSTLTGLFEEFIKVKNLPEKYIEVGRKIIT